MICFYLNDELIKLSNARADLTVLNYLRENKLLVGTKEGCAAGDCGACTVVVAELNANQDGLYYRTLNSCITFMAALHGKQLITVEHLSDQGEGNAVQPNELHPVQRALVDHHASQCGFCTPGFVMSMFGLYQNTHSITRPGVLTALSGNLCRCTGYRPIIDATLAVCNQARDDKFMRSSQQTVDRLVVLNEKQNEGMAEPTDNLLIPSTRSQLAQLIEQYPDAKLVAGSTDLALEYTQKLQPFDTLISLSHIANLRRVEVSATELTVGAALPLNDIQPRLIEHFPELLEIIDRFASVPIRNQATLGGNIANASPIGDMPPVCLALNASVNLDDGTRTRRIPISEFFIDYRKTTLQSGEWVDSIILPLSHLSDNNQEVRYIRAYKVSKRIEDDISAVCAVFNLTLNQGRVVSLSTGFGGVAATPISCAALEDSLVGQIWASKDCVAKGKQILNAAFEPIDDVRASAQYRNDLLSNLWHRFWLETNADSLAIQTRVISHA